MPDSANSPGEVDVETYKSESHTSKDRRPIDIVADADEARMAPSRLSVLPPAQRIVMSMRYGFGYSRPMSLQEVAAALGKSRVEVRNIEAGKS